MNRPLVMYSPNAPLGKNTIRDYFTEAGVLMGLTTPLQGHALRRLAITKMASGGVLISELMATARHSSVAASITYMQRNGGSDVAKMNALGVKF